MKTVIALLLMTGTASAQMYHQTAPSYGGMTVPMISLSDGTMHRLQRLHGDFYKTDDQEKTLHLLPLGNNNFLCINCNQ